MMRVLGYFPFVNLFPVCEQRCTGGLWGGEGDYGKSNLPVPFAASMRLL
ncbi:hypothetical protein RRSWK_06133 [Rhodopirellula sp. SWK7]|nr:hypothetical protein RRSWK_06133 [Rhodopirellula sp. SWK7]